MIRTLLAILLGTLAAQEPPKAPPSDEYSRIDQWVKDWQPTVEDRRMEEIGWAKDIPEAMRLAKQSGRPVFVFTHKGRIDLGRQ